MKESKLCEMINSRVQVEGGLFLKEAVYFRRTRRLRLLFLIRRPVTSALREEVERTAAELMPDCVKAVEVEIRRAYFDEEILSGFLADYLKKHAPAVSGCLVIDRLRPAGEQGGQNRLFFRADPAVRPYIEQNRFTYALADLLEQTFCEPFEVVVNYEALLPEGLPQAPEGEYRRPEQLRRIYIRDLRPLVGSPIDSPAAEYLIDMEKPRKSVVLCGRVERFSYRLTKTEKHMFRFVLKDFTGSLSCLYFSSEKNLEKLKAFEEGEHEILARGELKEDERSGLCFWVRDIGLCSLPAEFTPAPMPSRPAPERYSVVIPQKIELSAQENLFEAADSAVSPFFEGRSFVVFDTETTGLYYDLDRIIELGAVRIENGVICEGFHTMIDPGRAIPEKATAVNHITDDMVRGQPGIEKVLPDFFKFTRGAALVGHNVEFDVKFLQFAARKNGYFFENELFDTMELARENVKGLPNLQQKTVAAHFGIDVGNAHRALDDALTCARIFLEVMKIKYPPQKASA